MNNRHGCGRGADWLASLLVFVLPCFVWARGVTIQVDAGAQRHAISPFIYGVAYATQAQLEELNASLNRRGGSATSRYNWQANAANRGSDWFFESLPYTGEEPGAEVDSFITRTRAAGTEPLVTIPMMGWVARLGPSRARLASFSISKYGPQMDSDYWFSDAGNGIRPDGRYIINNPHDANLRVEPPFQRGWVQRLRSRWGAAAQGGVRYYTLDNEPSLWHESHRDVHPVGATMQEVRDKHLAYAALVKDAEPGALVFGPEEWGWSGYFYSGYDIQAVRQKGYTHFPDREANGGWDYLPWLLDQLRRNEQATGRRLLDVFTVHYYPQGGEFSGDVSPSMQLLRNRSTRSLWDPSYTDESWIQDKVMLIPRLKGWVETYYPGTRTGITEYNWGAEDHINGATAQADILGIFGREGLDYATRWETPDASTPTFKAMKLYRNYDNQKSTFGDVSVACIVPDPDTLSAFAAERTRDGALTVMVINKALSSGETPITLSLSGFTAGSVVQRWQLTQANVISRLEDLGASAHGLSTTVPGQSVTLFVIPAGVPGGNRAPVAHLLATPTSGPAPLTVGFNALGSVDPDGTIVSYAWNFGDGQSGTGPQVSHLYSQPGAYTAMLTVTDDDGASASTTVLITASSSSISLQAPGGFNSHGVGAEVTMRWTDTSVGEEGFVLERAPETWPLVFTEVGRVGANVTVFVDRPPAPGSYVYRASAFLGSSFSEYSNQDSARVGERVHPRD